MNSSPTTARRLQVVIEDWAFRRPFRITGHVFTASRVVVASLSDGERTGRGEAAGVYFMGETPESIAATIEAHRAAIEAGLTRAELQTLLPGGGARNALDCALWDLDSQRSGRTTSMMAELPPPRPLLTTFTVGAAEPAAMAAVARAYDAAKAIKVKLVGDAADAARVHAVRAACPDAWLAVDANQGLSPETLAALVPALVDCRVQLLEQPFAADPAAETFLDAVRIPIPIAADESALTRADLPRLKNRVSVINIKLDKSGGLTEALAMAIEARRLGLRVMVGGMAGTSLAMAPAFLVGQLAEIVDLDAPIFLAEDRVPGVVYQNGHITVPKRFWGGVEAVVKSR